MASEKRLNKKLPERVRREDSPGVRIDSGPFIGVIKNNIDPTRSGRLQVWIPDLGGDENDPKSWRTVSYASPFYGTTYQPDASKNNKFEEVVHSYGMWAVVPDVGNQVICLFIAGDANRGFWFACVNPNLSHYMVPAIAAGNEVDNSSTSDALKKKYDQQTSKWPVAEFNQNTLENIEPGWVNNKKPVHEFQANVLINQGLDRDGIRGAIGSNSQRETPSNVFGISTPGRPLKDPADDPAFAEKVKAGTLTDADYAIRGRKGGHTFVMDDGDQVGKDQLLRLRTAGGHQLLMNDTERVVYLANSDGSVWLEFTGGGYVNLYSAKGINVRTEGEFNLRADKDINIHSGGSIKMKAETAAITQTKDYYVKSATSFNVDTGKMGVLVGGPLTFQSAGGGWKSDGKLVLSGDKILLNTETPAAVNPVGEIQTYKQSDTSWNSEKGLWLSQPSVYESITAISPAHEPWPRGAGAGVKGAESLFGAAPTTEKQTSVCAPPGVTGGSLKNVNPSGGNNEALVESALRGYGISDATQLAAIMAQCAHESGNFRYLKELGPDSYFQKYEGRADLGNNQPGDGLKFKGRGFIQITGRDLYNKAGAYLNLDLINNPQLAEDPTTAAKLVLYFFFEYKKSRVASVNWGDVTAVTRIVNGGTNGLEDRKQKFAAYQQKYASGAVTSGSGAIVTDGSGQPIQSGASQQDPGPDSAKGKAVVDPAPAEAMKAQDAPSPGDLPSGGSKIPGLIPTQMKALMIEIGFANSKSSYTATDSAQGRIGRYMFNGNILRDYDYIKPDYIKQYGAAAVLRDDAYTGKDGIKSVSDFKGAKSTQDTLMETIIKDYYSRLVANQGITPGDDVCTVAGMISVAYFLRDSERGLTSGNPPDQAKFWRQQAETIKDKQGNSCTVPYNQGRYAIDVLSIATTGTAANSSVDTGPDGTDINPDSIFNWTSPTGTRENFDQLDRTFRAAILKMGRDYKAKTGKKITIASAYRSPADQERIYNTWIAAGGHLPDRLTAGGITTPALPVSMGGKLNAHGSGVAIDAGQQAAEINSTLNLTEYGLKWGGSFSKPDPVHIQLASFVPK